MAQGMNDNGYGDQFWEKYYCSVDLPKLYQNAKGQTMVTYRRWLDTLTRCVGGDPWKEKEALRRMNYIEEVLMKRAA